MTEADYGLAMVFKDDTLRLNEAGFCQKDYSGPDSLFRTTAYHRQDNKWVKFQESGSDLIFLASEKKAFLSQTGRQLIIADRMPWTQYKIRTFHYSGAQWLPYESIIRHTGEMFTSVNVSRDGQALAVSSLDTSWFYSLENKFWVSRRAPILRLNRDREFVGTLSLNDNGSVVALAVPGYDQDSTNTGIIRSL